MICDNCPLTYEVQAGEDCEVMCAATFGPVAYSVDGFNSGCSRTNKWINSQNREDLIAKHAAAIDAEIDREMETLAKS